MDAPGIFQQAHKGFIIILSTLNFQLSTSFGGLLSVGVLQLAMGAGAACHYCTPPAPGYHEGRTVTGSPKTFIISAGTCFLFTITI